MPTRQLPVPAAIALIAVAAFARPVDAGTRIWRSHGPSGALVTALAIADDSPSTLYAATVGGLYKTTDEAATWQRASAGIAIDDNGILDVAVDPRDPNRVYVATFSGGVFRSTDGGVSWGAANTGLPLAYPLAGALAVEATNPTTLYVSILGEGIYKTTDGAVTWNVASVGLPPTPEISDVVTDPRRPGTAYVAVFNAGIYKTTDGGASWSPASTGLTSAYPSRLAISPSSPDRLYVGTNGDGVFRSTDGGETWTDVTGSLPGTVITALAVEPDDENDVWLAIGTEVFRSGNGGTSWIAEDDVDEPVTTLAIHPTLTTRFYAGTSRGVFKKKGSADWTPASAGLDGAAVEGIAVDPLAPTTLYAAAGGLDLYGFGVFKSTDGAASWSAVNDGIDNGLVRTVAVDPATPSTVYASSAVRVHKSVDGGGSWTVAAAFGARALAVDPWTPDTLYAAGDDVRKSTDGGGSWQPASSGITASQVYALALDPGAPTRLYAGTNGGVFKSEDGAATWNPASTGMAIGLDVHALAAAPLGTVYAGTPVGIYKSVDAADSWSLVSGLGWVVALAIDPASPSTLYAGSYGQGVFVTTDGGGTWTPLNEGLATLYVLSLAVDAANPGVVHAGTFGAGVFTLHDCGDGTTDVGEECDDGNVVAGDGCSATCTLEPCRAAPMPLCRVAAQAQFAVSEKRPGKERLKLQWKKLSGSSTTADFGDPVGGTTQAILCLYDDVDVLLQGWVVDRGGQLCGAAACWTAKGGPLSYKDKLAAASGITKMRFKPGVSGKGQASAAGANNAAKAQTALPSGLFAVLQDDTQPTIQLLTSDGFCLGAKMNERTKNTGGEYKAKKK